MYQLFEVFVSRVISLFGKRRSVTQARLRKMTKRLGDSFPVPRPGEEMVESLPGSGC